MIKGQADLWTVAVILALALITVLTRSGFSGTRDRARRCWAPLWSAWRSICPCTLLGGGDGLAVVLE